MPQLTKQIIGFVVKGVTFEHTICYPRTAPIRLLQIAKVKRIWSKLKPQAKIPILHDYVTARLRQALANLKIRRPACGVVTSTTATPDATSMPHDSHTLLRTLKPCNKVRAHYAIVKSTLNPIVRATGPPPPELPHCGLPSPHPSPR